MRIAIVNDMQFAVEGLKRVLSTSPGYELAWVAENGEDAVVKCANDIPDLILMDLVMPVMGGVEATRRIMAESPCPILVVTSSVDNNAGKVFEAMGAGALDAVKTPVLGKNGEVSGDIALLSKIETIRKLTIGVNAKERTFAVERASSAGSSTGSLVAIGSSSGGPAALAQLLRSLPEDFPASVVIIQHVDAHFAEDLAAWLDDQCLLPVRTACQDDKLQPSTVYIAASSDHLVISQNGKLSYTSEPKKFVYRPSVDVFFDSVAKYWKGDTIAVLLTGMGRDGATGLLNLREMGIHTIAQDQASCAVYGMPKAAANMNAAVDILPINEIGPEVVSRIMKKPDKRRSEAL